VFSQGFNKAVQVQIDNVTDTTSEERIDEDKLQQVVYKYYAKHYKRGIIEGSNLFMEEPSIEELKATINLVKENKLVRILEDFKICKRWDVNHCKTLNRYCKEFNFELLAKLTAMLYYSKEVEVTEKAKAYDENSCKSVQCFLEDYSKGEISAKKSSDYFLKLYLRRN